MTYNENDETYQNIFIRLFSSDEEENSQIKNEKPFHISYIVICVVLVLFGLCGMSLNGWAIYLFTRTKTVSMEYHICSVAI